MASSRRKRSATIQSAINTAVYHAIFDEQCYIDPPKLSPELWDSVSIQLPANRAENERLEFLGDALMDACIAIELYKAYPDGNPHKYTEVLSVVHSNFTFSHMVHKMGLTIAADTKSIGDVFETMIGAYFTERGFDSLHAWVKRAFFPVIEAAAAAFDKHQKQKGKQPAVDCPPRSPVQASSTRGASDFTASSSRMQDATADDDGTIIEESSFNARGLHQALDPADLGPSTNTQHPRGNRTPDALHSPSSPIFRTPRFERPLKESHLEPDVKHKVFDASGSVMEEISAPVHNSRASNTWASLGSPTPGASNLKRPASPSDKRNWHPAQDFASESSSEDEDSEDDSLPEFWEEVRLPEGEVIYVDHRTQTTSWERPRKRSSRKYQLQDPALAWTARLRAPLPELLALGDKKSPTTSPEFADVHNSPTPSPVSGLIVELVRDGYVLGDASTDFSRSGSVPDFWEVHRGEDGHTYYINHPAGNILRSVR